MMIGNAASTARTIPAAGVNGARGGAMFNIDAAKEARGTDNLQEALAAFRSEARKTPRERCHDQVMKD